MRGTTSSILRLARRARVPFQPPPQSNIHNRFVFILRRLTATSSFHRNASFTSFAHTPPFRFLTGQRRSMFIQTQATPNPSSLMFYPGKPVMEVGSSDFPNPRSAMNSPLAKSLFAIDGPFLFSPRFCFCVLRDSIQSDFFFFFVVVVVVVVVVVQVLLVFSLDPILLRLPNWKTLPEIFAAIMDFYSSGQPLFLDSQASAAMDTAIHQDDSETVAMIKELLETRIRPAVQDDGGDIEYRGFDLDTGIVKLKMQGACSGCPSSSVTLKSGIENMLMHYVPEVKGVEQELDAEDDGATLSGQMQ